MTNLFIEKSITIDAPVEKIWQILTDNAFTRQWIQEGWGKLGVEDMNIYSDWKPGSEVRWKKEDDTLLVKGNITKLVPYKLLRFTVIDVNSKEKFVPEEEDGITFIFDEQNESTILTVRHGNFALLKEGKKNYEQTKKVWDAALPKIKELAEADKDTKALLTCGKGLAEHSTLIARSGEWIASMAENLELHMKTVDLSDHNGRLEFEAYEKLSKAQKDIADRLTALALDMYSYYDLPMAEHDEKKLSSPKIAEAFKRFAHLEQELMTLLNKRIKKEEKMLTEMTHEVE